MVNPPKSVIERTAQRFGVGVSLNAPRCSLEAWRLSVALVARLNSEIGSPHAAPALIGPWGRGLRSEACWCVRGPFNFSSVGLLKDSQRLLRRNAAFKSSS
ncbi:hypothetical protein EYF80_057892 [Liparis tanakae]|uniref:Uncharacterized protein n=1 Tax=Liparis tanakae TaxID=230148 RepID=A0A4Z2ET11_9TELE|nr:hypothetical protein EYF80_057892 [Liparis tanakae]